MKEAEALFLDSISVPSAMRRKTISNYYDVLACVLMGWVQSILKNTCLHVPRFILTSVRVDQFFLHCKAWNCTFRGGEVYFFDRCSLPARSEGPSFAATRKLRPKIIIRRFLKTCHEGRFWKEPHYYFISLPGEGTAYLPNCGI
jgi:hypothetical protein